MTVEQELDTLKEIIMHKEKEIISNQPKELFVIVNNRVRTFVVKRIELRNTPLSMFRYTVEGVENAAKNILQMYHKPESIIVFVGNFKQTKYAFYAIDTTVSNGENNAMYNEYYLTKQEALKHVKR